jgi:outer membrane biosynthesis protein TonB
MGFKRALLISILGHCFIIVPLGNLWMLVPRKKAEDFQIVYYKTTPIEIENTKDLKIQKTTSVQQPQKPKPITKKTAAVKKTENQKPQETQKSMTEQARPPETAPREALIPKKEDFIPPSIPGTTLPNTPECVSYYQYIREKIRLFLKKNYVAEYDQGDVGISFALTQSGELASLSINERVSSDDPFLRHLACDSIKTSTPFKPFPKGINQKQISFSLTVVFKHQ